MNKQIFLNELEYLLQDIAEEDREDALGYYEDYFNDAGEAKETQILTELQSPERVAALIKAGLNEHFEETIEYSETSMGDSRYNKQHEMVIPKNEVLEPNGSSEKQENQSTYKSGKDNQENKLPSLIGLVVLGGVILLFGLPILGTGLLIVASFILLVFCFAVVIGGFGIASASMAIFIFLKSLWILHSYPMASLVGIGVSLLLFALAIVLFMGVKWPFRLLSEISKIGRNLVYKGFNKIGGLR